MKPVRGTRLLAGGVLPGTRSHRLIPAAASREDDASLHIEEPLRFHLARYGHLTRGLHGRLNLAAALLTTLILIMLGWRAQDGESISPARWLCGLLSGWFIIAMLRLALFTCLAAPRFICWTHGKLQISGLGTLRPGQIHHWSIEHKVMLHECAKPCAKFIICCRKLGCERHWTMLMEEGRQTEQLQRLLDLHLPGGAQSSGASLSPAIQIEAGLLS